MRITTDSRLFSTDNEWGIPSLDPELQPAAIAGPVVCWGSVARTTQHGGTWVFYTDDWRFASARLVEQIVASDPSAAVEPNYSVYDWTPRAEVLWSVYRKRRIARELQEAGVPVLVDLCMPACHAGLALLGVPRGWRAYATRGFEARADDVRAEHAIATEHAGGRPLLLVFGGGKRIAELCRELPGAIHCPDHMGNKRWRRAAAKVAAA